MDCTGSAAIRHAPPHGAAERPSRSLFFGVVALLFIAAATGTAIGCRSMATMGGMAMPGGWTLSMMWMRMPGQSWPGVFAAFLGMWVLMIAAMMLPALAPMLWRYRQAAGRNSAAPFNRFTALVAAGYFSVWAATGAIAFPLGALLATLELQSPPLARAVPLVAAMVVLVAGITQFSAWKARQLACCREMPGLSVSVSSRAAWRHGLRLGLRCGLCCAGPSAVLFALGTMDLTAMAVVTAAISAERLAPAGMRVAHSLGVLAVAGGLILLACAVGGNA